MLLLGPELLFLEHQKSYSGDVVSMTILFLFLEDLQQEHQPQLMHSTPRMIQIHSRLPEIKNWNRPQQPSAQQ